jgi:hypothetical protein
LEKNKTKQNKIEFEMNFVVFLAITLQIPTHCKAEGIYFYYLFHSKEVKKIMLRNQFQSQ